MPEPIRCWTTTDPAYNAYHDEEWGRLIRDERGLYERLCLEGFQSGLAWITILRKREALRAAFGGFDPERVARFEECASSMGTLLSRLRDLVAGLAVAAALLLAPSAGAANARAQRIPLGRSQDGRLIVAYRVGNPNGLPVLVVGCIHGTECAGIPVAQALERVHTNLDLWIVPNLNPDGYAAGTRQNARGVDLNKNWSYQWKGGGRPWDVYYPGPRPFSERESRIARRLILRVRPRVTIWYHQHMDLVWAWAGGSRAGRIYARAAAMTYYHHHNLPGTAINWGNHDVPAKPAFDVELPPGSLSPAAVRRHTAAVLAVGNALAP